MTTKTVKLAMTQSGGDAVLNMLTSIAEKKNSLTEQKPIELHLNDTAPIEDQLDALSSRFKELTGEGGELEVHLAGADTATSQLDALGDSSKSAATQLDSFSGQTSDVSVALEKFTAAQTEAADSAERLSGIQADAGASSADYTAGLDAVTAATLRSLDAQIELGNAELATSGKAAEAGGEQEALAAKTDATSASVEGASSKFTMLGIGLAVAAGASLKLAGDFDSVTTRLVTSAGESESNLGMVRAGILSISSATATSASQLASGMYMIESAGFHGAAGLDVLKASAEGARAEGADLADVSNAVTSALNAYHLKASDAVQVTDELVKTVGQGKMTMQDLASSIHSVLPVAAAAHVSLAQVGGAIATMTMQGMSAKQATQDLSHTIQALQNPNNVAVAEMEQLGLSATDVEKNIGTRGLTGTIQLLEGTVLKNMGPSGEVMLKAFNQSKDAAKDLNIMIQSMPASVQKLAKEYMSGSVSLSAFRKAIPTNDAGMIGQFTTLYNKVHGFNQQLTSGTPAAQTFTAAMAKVMGGTTGLNTALMIGGQNMPVFESNVRAISDSAKTAGANVTDWSLIQSQFNFKLAQTKDSAQDVAISFGNVLMPAAEAVIKPIAAFGAFLAQNSAASKVFAGVVGGLLTLVIGTKLVQGFLAAKSAAESLMTGIGKLAVLTGIQTEATEGATAAEDGLNLAFLANPIVLIIAGLVLLGVAFYELITHCKAFRDFWIDIWKGIEGAAKTVWAWLKANWQLLIAALFTIATGGLSLLGLEIYKHWHDVESWTDSLRSTVTSTFDGLMHDIESIWDSLWADTLGLLIRGIQNTENYLANFRHWIDGLFSNLRHDISGAWNLIWSDTIGREISGIQNITSWFSKLPGDITRALGSLGAALVNLAKAVLSEMLQGFEGAAGPIINFFKGLGSGIAGAFKSVLKIFSPSAVFHNLGTMIAQGLANGINAGSGMVGKAMGNVTSIITQVLKMSGKPMSWLGPLEVLVSKESGGNQSAVDPISVDGEHATGMWQMLPSTFREYSRGGSLTNGVSEGLAAVNYIASEYGSPANIPGLLSGSYVGYDQGGILSPGFHMVANLSGRNEQVVPAGGSAGGAINLTINCHPSNNPDEVYETVWQGLRNLRRHKGNQPLGLG